MIEHYVQEQTRKSVPVENTKGILDPIILLEYKLHDQQAFPRFLPVELAFNCTNGSHISLTIGGFPTEITFQSKKNFYEEHQKSLSCFFQDASSICQKEAVPELVDAGLLQKQEVVEYFIFDHPVMLQEIRVPVLTTQYIHGPKGCSNEKTFVKPLIDAKVSPDKSMFKSLIHRELTGSFK
ncbi:MAG TPA: hypothetical protein VKU36_01720 [Candidatus Babeliales bacterium]|nr:hypothetical protein [Candidatus Babeliales bacterium]